MKIVLDSILNFLNYRLIEILVNIIFGNSMESKSGILSRLFKIRMTKFYNKVTFKMELLTPD